MVKIGTTLIMFLIAVGLFFGFTQPEYEATKTLSSQGDQLDRILAEATEFQRLKSALIARYNALPTDQLTRLSKLIPDNVDNVRLILDVDSLASRNGLSLENVTINAKDTDASSQQSQESALGSVSEQRTPYGSLTLQFSTSGSYDQFVSFLHSLEQSLRLVDVVDLKLQSSGDTEGGYSYEVKLRTYWLK